MLGVAPGMRALMSAPLYHSAPAAYAVQAALSDAHLVIEPKFDAERTLQLIESERLTHLYLVPTMYVRLLRLGDGRAPPPRPELGALRRLERLAVRRRREAADDRLVGAGVPRGVCGERARLDLAHRQPRGPAAARLGGPGDAGVQLKVLSAEGQEVAPGTVGLLYARDPAIPDFTYANNDAARRKLERDGLWTLGDMGYLDADGYLYVVDRQNDMVIAGGVNIYPAEIEAVLITMPGVADCAVFGIPDAEFGEALAAAVQPVAAAALDAAGVQAFLRERLAGFKVPRVVAFHAELPREDTGKIFKRRLREPYWAGPGTAHLARRHRALRPDSR